MLYTHRYVKKSRNHALGRQFFMLLDFTVENYRSIKGAETLSAVAQKLRRTKTTQETSNRQGVKDDRTITPGYSIPGWNLEILPVLAIFGANASGKSNIVQALDYLLLLMLRGTHGLFTSRGIASPSITMDFSSYSYRRATPFYLNQEAREQPTKFELRTVFEDRIYTYSLEMTSDNHIHLEALDYSLASSKRARKLFHRKWNRDQRQFDWTHGEDFRGAHLHLTSILKEDELFLNLLARLEVKVIEPLMKWLFTRFPGTGLSLKEQAAERQDAIIAAYKDSNVLEKIVNIVRKFDTGISDIRIDQQELSGDSRFEYLVHTIHDAEVETVEFLLQEESAGTQRLFGIAFRTYRVLESGSLLIMDELGASLHPHIVYTIVRLFQNPKTNPKGAQLIFTSHDNTLQRNHLLRRDQIWFTQMRPDHSTDLYPLTDFKVRNDLAIDKAYLDGRFGAVPLLPADEIEFLMPAD